MSIRSTASCCQPRVERVVPRGARTGRGPEGAAPGCSVLMARESTSRRGSPRPNARRVALAQAAGGRPAACGGARQGRRPAISCSPNRRSPSENSETSTPALAHVRVVDAQAAGAGRDVDGPAAELRLRVGRRRRPPGRRRPRRRCRASRRNRPRSRRPARRLRHHARRQVARRRRRSRTPRAPRWRRTHGSVTASANASGSSSTATPDRRPGRTASSDGSSTASAPGRATRRPAGGRRARRGSEPSARRGSARARPTATAVRGGRRGGGRGRHGRAARSAAARPAAAASAAPAATGASPELPPQDREALVRRGDGEAQPLPERRRRRRSSRRASRRPPGRSRPPRTRARRGRRRRPRPACAASPRSRAAAVVAMHVITAGSGEDGQPRVEVPGPQGPRVRGQRAELDVAAGSSSIEQHLGVGAEDGECRGPAAGASAGASAAARGGLAAPGRTGCRRPVVVRRGTG